MLLLIGLSIYILFINVIGYVVYRADKKRILRGKSGIADVFLLAISILGGAIGALIEMNIYSHKTTISIYRKVNYLSLVAYGVLFIVLIFLL